MLPKRSRNITKTMNAMMTTTKRTITISIWVLGAVEMPAAAVVVAPAQRVIKPTPTM